MSFMDRFTKGPSYKKRLGTTGQASGFSDASQWPEPNDADDFGDYGYTDGAYGAEGNNIPPTHASTPVAAEPATLVNATTTPVTPDAAPTNVPPPQVSTSNPSTPATDVPDDDGLREEVFGDPAPSQQPVPTASESAQEPAPAPKSAESTDPFSSPSDVSGNEGGVYISPFDGKPFPHARVELVMFSNDHNGNITGEFMFMDVYCADLTNRMTESEAAHGLIATIKDYVKRGLDTPMAIYILPNGEFARDRNGRLMVATDGVSAAMLNDFYDQFDCIYEQQAAAAKAAEAAASSNEEDQAIAEFATLLLSCSEAERKEIMDELDPDTKKRVVMYKLKLAQQANPSQGPAPTNQP